MNNYKELIFRLKNHSEVLQPYNSFVAQDIKEASTTIENLVAEIQNMRLLVGLVNLSKRK